MDVLACVLYSSIDALSQFQRCLGQVNIKAPSIDKLPSAVSTWLFEILEANADNRDLLVDGTAFQPEFELLDDLPLAEGHISSGKLHLGRSAVASVSYTHLDVYKRQRQVR